MARRIKPYIIEELEIIDAASDGRGVARHDGQVIFVEGAVPGDLVRADVYRKEKKFRIARILAILEPSPARRDAKCIHFGTCGGCRWQHLAYEKQLFFKQKQVTDAFERIGKVIPDETSPILGCENEYYYRNKLEFTFSAKRWLTQAQIDSGENFDTAHALGFHVPKFFDKILDIKECHLQDPVVNKIRNGIRDFAAKEEIPFYDIRSHEGFLRNLVFRISLHSSELMLILITAGDDCDPVTRIMEYVKSSHPEVTSMLWIINTKLNDSYSDLDWHVLFGRDYLIEDLGGWKYRIGPTSFFQTNPKQAKRLYDVVREMVGAKRDVIYDLYAGAGSIGIYINDLANKIVGVEYVDAAVEDAAKNLELNALHHLEFYAGDMKDLLDADFVKKHGKPEVIVTDPPRAGMAKEVVDAILAIGPDEIVYVSCNPATQARDVNLLSDAYRVKKIQPVDMFPQTTHVENVAWLVRK